MKPGWVKRADAAARLITAAGCVYEALAIGTRRCPTVSSICRTRRAVGASLVCIFAMHIAFPPLEHFYSSSSLP
jgi:hypothetical protein